MLVASMTLVALLASCGSESDGGGSGEASGGRAPAFSFETFEGTTFSSAEQKGTPVVLNFWESW
jgi:AhpC/TSA family